MANALAAPAAPRDLSAFAYDATAPLDLSQRSSEQHAGVELRDITFASPRGGVVPAYLVRPRGKGPFAGIVFLHWGEGDRSEFLAEALLLAQAYAVSILIDAPFVRSGSARRAWNDADAYVQMVIDVRRAVDVLASLPEVDADRIAYVGHSLGATWGGALAVAERRFKALVLMAGLPSLSRTLRKAVPLDDMSAEQRARQEAFVAGVAPYDAALHLGRAAPAAIFLQFARADRNVSHEEAMAFAKATSRPKTVRWYEGGHELTDIRALPDRADFLRKHLGIDDIRLRMRSLLRTGL